MIRAATWCALLAGCADAPPVVVFAAASTTDVVEAVVARSPHPDQIAVSVAASSVLARQIAAGAPADVFVSADSDWVDWLAAQGVSVGRRRVVASGRLVVAGPRSAQGEPALRGRIALADPSHVPAGRYARRALARLGRWAEVAPEAVYVADVRAALAAVQTGAADRAIVYASDVRERADVSVWPIFPAMPEIQFVVAEIGAPSAVFDALAAPHAWRQAGFEAAP